MAVTHCTFEYSLSVPPKMYSKLPPYLAPNRREDCDLLLQPHGRASPEPPLRTRKEGAGRESIFAQEGTGPGQPLPTGDPPQDA